MRREANMARAADSVLELFAAGVLDPTFEDVAAASGLSVRSLYRYFESKHVLQNAAAQRSLERFGPMFVFPGVGEGPLEERIERIVRSRVSAYEAAAPLLRAARSRAASDPEMATRLRSRMALLRLQAETQFGPELSLLDAERRAASGAAIDALLQLQSIGYLIDRGDEAGDVMRFLQLALRRLLTGAGDDLTVSGEPAGAGVADVAARRSARRQR
jgi:AcrR family transcriptional regulator